MELLVARARFQLPPALLESRPGSFTMRVPVQLPFAAGYVQLDGERPVDAADADGDWWMGLWCRLDDCQNAEGVPTDGRVSRHLSAVRQDGSRQHIYGVAEGTKALCKRWSDGRLLGT